MRREGGQRKICPLSFQLCIKGSCPIALRRIFLKLSLRLLLSVLWIRQGEGVRIDPVGRVASVSLDETSIPFSWLRTRLCWGLGGVSEGDVAKRPIGAKFVYLL